MATAGADLALTLMSEEVVRRAAHALAKREIPLMLLKGALWRRTLYAQNESRPFVDVDVIVPEARFGEARRALMAAGFAPRPNPQGPHEQEFVAAELPLLLDLHRSLFARGRYALDSRGLFARAQADETLFGVRVLIPDLRDQLAHLLGHLANDHRPGDSVYRGDFARLVAQPELSPERAGEHLRAHGLGRAARFALAELATPASAPWAQRCHAALGSDPVGEFAARVARSVVAKRGRFSTWSALASHALNSDGAHAAEALLWAVFARVKASMS